MFALAVATALAATTIFQQSVLTGCSLFSADDISSVLGEPVLASNSFGCQYESPPGTQPFRVIRWIPDYPSATDFQADARRVATENDAISTFTPVDGVGDEAYAYHDGLGYTWLDVRSGSHSVAILVDLGVFGATDTDAKVGMERQLASIAISRLATGVQQ